MKRLLTTLATVMLFSGLAAGADVIPKIPPGTSLRIRLGTTLTSKTNKPGDTFRGEVLQDVVANGKTIVPEGSLVSGHVFETSNGGATWGNASGNLPDAPMSDIVFNNGKLIVASDFGVFVSSDNGATWSHLGTNLPNVVVDQLKLDPNGVLVAATHGRGIWTIAAP